MDLSIIIVNYKTPTLVSGCLKSIYSTVSDVEFEIIVVDNGSNDDSQKIVTSAFPQVIWIANDTNEGFGRANNLGIKKSKGEYLLLLNSDIVVIENTVNQCLNEIKNRKDIGALGCLLLNEDGSFQKFTYSIASFRKMLDLNLVFNYFIKRQKFKIDAIMGAFMLIPKRVLDECGCFDPDFFFFSEEIELCHRIKRGGYSIVCLEDVNAIHKGSGSNTDRSWAIKQSFLSSALLFLKVRGWGGYYLYHFVFLINVFTNFFAMWLLDRFYRKEFYKATRYYFSNFGQYIVMPFYYSTKMGNGKRLLKLGD